MKKIKLLTPILGLTTLTGFVAPVMTSCSGVGHVWLTSIDQQEKTGNASGITYYFGLDSEYYEAKDIDVQACSDNKDEINTEWSVSGSVLIVVVKYLGKIETDATKKVDFKLRIKTTTWSQEFDLKMNVTSVSDFNGFMTRYTEIYKNNVKDIEDEKEYSCKLAKGDHAKDEVSSRTISINDPDKYDFTISRGLFEQDDIIELRMWVIVEDKQTNEKLTIRLTSLYDPDTTKYFYETLILPIMDEVKYKTPADGSLELYMCNENQKVNWILDKDMQFKFISSEEKSKPDNNMLLHISNIQPL